MSQLINTALLSYGMSGQVFHAPLLQAAPGFVLTHVLRRTSAAPIAGRPDVNVVSDIDDLLRHAELELVVINTPNESHYAYAKKAIEAGKHVVVEKPFTITSEEADELIALAARRNVVLSVFQNRRWDGDFLTVKRVIESGMLGQVVEFESHYDRYRPHIEANTWKEAPGPGSGILYNLGSHMLDQALVLFGWPEAVDARLGALRPGSMVDDFYDIRLLYPGKLVTIKSGYLVREQGPRYVVHGVNGSFVKYGIDPQEQALKDGKSANAPGWGQEPPAYWGKLNTTTNGLHVEGSIETLAGDYPGFYANIHAAIRSKQPLAVPAAEARQVIRLIEASIESNQRRTTVSL